MDSAQFTINCKCWTDRMCVRLSQGQPVVYVFCNSHIEKPPCRSTIWRGRLEETVAWCRSRRGYQYAVYYKENQQPGQSIKVLLKEVIQLPVSVVCRDYTNVLMAFRAC